MNGRDDTKHVQKDIYIKMLELVVYILRVPFIPGNKKTPKTAILDIYFIVVFLSNFIETNQLYRNNLTLIKHANF